MRCHLKLFKISNYLKNNEFATLNKYFLFPLWTSLLQKQNFHKEKFSEEIFQRIIKLLWGIFLLKGNSFVNFPVITLYLENIEHFVDALKFVSFRKYRAAHIKQINQLKNYGKNEWKLMCVLFFIYFIHTRFLFSVST